MNKCEIKRHKNSYRRHLSKIVQPNCMLTFNFNYEVSPKHGDNKMRHFFCVIQRKGFGPNWADQYDREWPEAYGFWERDEKYKKDNAGNPHWHTLARLDDHLAVTIKREGSPLWRGIVPGGSLDVQMIDPPGKWKPIRYCTKGLWKEEALENVFIYSDTRPKRPMTEGEFDQQFLAIKAELLSARLIQFVNG